MQLENHENHENIRISNENNENLENLRIPLENNENHQTIKKIHLRFKKIMHKIEFQ